MTGEWIRFGLTALCVLAGCQKKVEPNVHEDETLEVSDSVQTAKAETEPFYVMIVGNDSRTGTVEITKPEYSDGTGRSDVAGRDTCANHGLHRAHGFASRIVTRRRRCRRRLKPLT